MPEPARSDSQESSCVDPRLLQSMALRYAAGDLDATDAAAFENRLANDQDTREALSEAVRLSAAALGQKPPVPSTSLRRLIEERLRVWSGGWLARRVYRGHPLAWAGLGAVVVAVSIVLLMSVIQQEPETARPTTNGASQQAGEASGQKDSPLAPEPRAAGSEQVATPLQSHEQITTVIAPSGCASDSACNPSVAEIWATLNTTNHIEKDHDEELRWRQKLRDIQTIHHGRPTPNPTFSDGREP